MSNVVSFPAYIPTPPEFLKQEQREMFQRITNEMIDAGVELLPIYQSQIAMLASLLSRIRKALQSGVDLNAEDVLVAHEIAAVMLISPEALDRLLNGGVNAG